MRIAVARPPIKSAIPSARGGLDGQGYIFEPTALKELPEVRMTPPSLKPSPQESRTLSPGLECLYLLVFWLPPWTTRTLNPAAFFLSIFYLAGYVLFLVFGLRRLLVMVTGVHHQPISIVCFCHALAMFILVNGVIIGSTFHPLTHHQQLVRSFRPTLKSSAVIVILQVPVMCCLVAKLIWHFNHFIVLPVQARPECFLMACFFHGYLRFVVNGLWLFVTLFLVDCLSRWRLLPYLEQLRRLHRLNGQVGVVLAFLVGTTVCDAISSMVFYTISPESFSNLVLVHEVFIVFYDIFFNMLTAELSTRIVTQIRSSMHKAIESREPTSRSSTSYLEQLELSAHSALAVPAGIDAAGVFTHNRRFFISMCSTTLTFLLILCQMSGDVSQRFSNGLARHKK